MDFKADLPLSRPVLPKQTGSVSPEDASALLPMWIAAMQAEASPAHDILHDGEAYHALNAEQQFAVAFEALHIALQPRGQEATLDSSLEMRLAAYGYDSALQPMAAAERFQEGNRLEYRRPGLTEWYVNGPLGLEQGFTLENPPSEKAGHEPLILELALTEGADFTQINAASVLLTTPNRLATFRYGHLYVMDALGQSLPAQLRLPTANPSRLQIIVDDRNAVYPITVDPLIQQGPFTASDGAAGDQFGFSVAISGNFAVIGAPGKTISSVSAAGEAYVFAFEGGTWKEKIKLSSLRGGTPTANDQFGCAVAIDKDTIIVGADQDSGLGSTGKGLAYVFRYNGSAWTLEATLTAPVAEQLAGDRFGFAVAISGNTAAIAADQLHASGGTGKVYVFTRTGSTWGSSPTKLLGDGSTEGFASSVAISGDTLVVGAPVHAATFTGAIYIYTRSGSIWSAYTQRLNTISSQQGGLGFSVAVSGDTVLAGAPTNDFGGASFGGGVFVYTRANGSWPQQAYLTASDEIDSDYFGYSVSISGDVALVGEYRRAAAYLLVRSGNQWVQQPKLIYSGIGADGFGRAVSLDGMNAILGTPVVNSSKGAVYVYAVNPAPTNTGAPHWPLAWAGELFSDNSINIRTGEKMLEATDISVNTPVGLLAFTRTYRLSKKGNPPFMGMGWMHNHAASLSVVSGGGATPRRVLVQLPNAGELYFTETGANTNAYTVDAGSDATLTGNITAQATLTATDRSTYIFNGSGRLTSRSWPSTETWTYTYDANNRLSQIDDGYGRQLKFSYISNAGQFNDGQLWRVGDQNATGLSGASPAGRYVEFGYTTQKQNGVVITSPKPLLNTIRDVMGNTWTYNYYGQVAGQTDANQWDYLIESLSPAVDRTGAVDITGTTMTLGSPISIEKLIYTVSAGVIQSILQSRGDDLLKTQLNFPAKTGQNTTVETEVVSGKAVTHSFNGGVYGGIKDTEGNYASQYTNPQYRPEMQTDANGNRTQLSWTADGKHLLSMTDAAQQPTSFNYNLSGQAVDTVDYSLDAQGHKTKYTYGDARPAVQRLPTRIQVYDTNGTTLLNWQEFTYDTKGRPLTEKLFDPTGTTVQQQVEYTYYTSGNGNGLLQTMTRRDLITAGNDVVTTHFYDSIGRLIKKTENTTFGSCTASFTLYDNANNVLATICNYDPTVGPGPDPTTVAEATALFNPANPDLNRVTTYRYDTLGRKVLTTVDDGAPWDMMTLTAYDSLSRVIRTIVNYDLDPATIPDPYVRVRTDFSHGTNNDIALITDTAYNERGMIRSQMDPLGNVTLHGYSDAGRLIKVIQNASNPTYNNKYSGTGSDPSLSNYVLPAIPSQLPDLDLIALLEYDKAGNVVRATDPLGNVTLTDYDTLNRPIKVVRFASQPAYNIAADPTLAAYTTSSAADQDLIEVTEYDSLGRVRRTQDAIGNWTLFGYDGLGRVVKTIRFASNPTYFTASPTDYSLSGYTESIQSDQDFVSRTAYDVAGRVMNVADVIGRKTWTAYDGLWRTTKTIVNAIGSATDGSANDPRSPSYVPSATLFDQDRITLTEYDANRRIWRTRDGLGNYTLYGNDSVNRQVKVIRNASNFNYNYVADPTLASYTPAGGATADQDVVTQTTYDGRGRVASTTDARANQTRYTYDGLNRVIKTIANYVTGTYNSANPDQDLVSTTVYDVGGRVTSTVDARGTQTTFVYDAAGRQISVTQAANTTLVTKSYTSYDKGGRALRTVQNWVPDPTQTPIYPSRAPDEKDTAGNWKFNPATHGGASDQNLISTYTLDKVGRPTVTGDPVSDTTGMTYYKDGQVESMTDPLGTVTKYRYDRARRRVTTVQGYVAGSFSDPATWVWSSANARWQDGSNAPITFGGANDQNVITQVTYDKAGRMLTQRDPRGNQTSYQYDLLDRRINLTDPLSHVWATAYVDNNGGIQTTLTDPNTKQTRQTLDKLGRLATLQYLAESPKLTPDITFTYDKNGNRLGMSESNGAVTVRNTTFSYDKANRMTQASFDRAGDGTDVQVVGYQYDAGGLRTRLTLPGSLNVTYTYNSRGQLISLADWSNPATQYTYDAVDRVSSAQHANNLKASFGYDPAGRLRLVRHTNDRKTLGHFAYDVDARGNRTRAFEAVARVGTGTTTYLNNDPAVAYNPSWTAANPYQVATDVSASLGLAFVGSQATLIMGQGPDHSIYDLYVDGDLWQTVDGYAATAGDAAFTLTTNEDGPHVLEVRNRPNKDLRSGGYQVRFKSLATISSAPLADVQTWSYSYDALARLSMGMSYPGVNAGGQPLKGYIYSYDLASNLLQKNVFQGGIATPNTYTYDNANRLATSSAGGGPPVTLSYDNNGNLTNNGTNAYTWDRANRLLSEGGVANLYNGAGQRVQQTVGANITKYVLDVQLGLWKLIQATTGSNNTRYVHGPLGVQQQQTPLNAWNWLVEDAQGSVRSVLDNSLNPLESRRYSPYGELTQTSGSSQTVFGYTSEPTDSNGLVYLRARYLNPSLGQFISLDPMETPNRYAYVMGNPVNRTDPSGLRQYLDGESYTPIVQRTYMPPPPVNPVVQILQKFVQQSVQSAVNTFNQVFHPILKPPVETAATGVPQSSVMSKKPFEN